MDFCYKGKVKTMTENITELLRNNGYKVNQQLLAIYEALCATKEHPKAETLFVKLQPTYPTMSLATVYKTIDILKKIGKIRVLNTGEDSFRYDADITSHHHVQCTVCGRVDDVYEAVDQKALKKIEKQTGYTITEQRVYFFGKCAKCNK